MMTSRAIPQSPSAVSLNDRYLALLAFSLMGYALLGKGYAYVGVPPLFIGEILFVLGLAAFLATGCWIAVMANLPNLLLAALMALVLMRTIPYVGPYGLDAARDSVIVMYGGFAFVVAALLLEKPDRIKTIFRYFQKFVIIYAPSVLVLYLLTRFAGDSIPTWPSSGVPIVLVRTGEMGVHLGGAAVLALLGLVRVRLWWTIALVAAILTVAAQSRGGALACLVPIVAAAMIAGKFKQIAAVALAGAAVLSVLIVTDLKIDMDSAPSAPIEARSFGAEQIVKNLSSIVGQSEGGALDGTKAFRLNWWAAIQNYTFNGPYFWTGKGFGVNLSESDGFIVSEGKGAPPLRSPHNGHMTILARSGVPGLFLWAATLTVWFVTLGISFMRARQRNDMVWANFFLFIASYVAGIIIDATFDVALEGPILGIWFWSLIGIGVGATMIYGARRMELTVDDPRPGAAAAGRAAAARPAYGTSIEAGMGAARGGFDPSARAPRRTGRGWS